MNMWEVASYALLAIGGVILYLGIGGALAWPLDRIMNEATTGVAMSSRGGRRTVAWTWPLILVIACLIVVGRLAVVATKAADLFIPGEKDD